jgi:hypothetical protein
MRNGASKPTAVRILATLLRPDGGHARVCGHDVVLAGTTWPGRNASMISSARSREPADLEDLPRVGADLERPQHRDLHVTILPGAG